MKNNDNNYDVIVLGGGPAGSCSAGFLAKKGFRVALFEKEQFPRYHIGESLLPATTLGVLNLLGAAELIEKQGFPVKYGGTFNWGIDKEPWTLTFFRRGEADEGLGEHPQYLHSYQVKRDVFDHLLLNHVRNLGVEVHEKHSFVGIADIDAEQKIIRVKSGKAENQYTAPYIIDASGRTSSIAKQFGERHYDPFFRNVAVYGYFEQAKRLPGERCGNIYCVAFDKGWFWYIPLSQGEDKLTSVGVVLARNVFDDLKKTYSKEEILNRMIETTPDIKSMLEQAKPCTVSPYDKIHIDIDYSYCHSQFSYKGIFLAGDAACFIDPIFSSGVHLASYAGYAAANAIERIHNNEVTYQKGCQEYTETYLREYRFFHRLLTSFYDMQKGKSSYFCEARKIFNKEAKDQIREDESFIRLISGLGSVDSEIIDAIANSYSETVQGLNTFIEIQDGNIEKLTKEEIEKSKRLADEILLTPEKLYREAKKTKEIVR